MSIANAAQLVRAQGRNNDSELMHVTPGEVQALQGIAQLHGGSLTRNPQTGLPEAGFLENILPTLVGVGVGFATANPLLGAAAADAEEELLLAQASDLPKKSVSFPLPLSWVGFKNFSMRLGYDLPPSSETSWLSS
jgi:hypothetical protein